MIKVNLLNNFTGGTAVVSPTGTVVPAQTATASASRSTPKEQVEALLKIVSIFIPLTLVIGYESYNTSRLVAKEAKIKAERKASEAKLVKLKAEVEAVKKFQENKKLLENKIGIIRDLSKERLRNVKALEALQALIPTKCWLTEMEIKDGKVSLKGFAIDDTDVAQLMAGLEESVYYTNVLLKEVVSDRTKQGVTKKFHLEVFLENL